MARKRGRPPKSPSPSSTEDLSKTSPVSQLHDIEILDEDDMADIDNLSPKQAEVLLKNMEAIRSRIKGKSPANALLLEDAEVAQQNKDSATKTCDQGNSNPDPVLKKASVLDQQGIAKENIEDVIRDDAGSHTVQSDTVVADSQEQQWTPLIISSFKSYGKVDEHEQMLLEAKRKTRKRITIISLSTVVVLVGVVCAAVFGGINISRDNNSQVGANSQSGPNAVKAVCDVTLYKDSCYRSLGSLVHSGQVQPEELLMLSINVALTKVSKALNYFSEHGDFDGSIDSRNKEAVKNCRELLDLAVDHLNSSLSSGENSSILEVFDDLQTWLSAAGTITSIHAISQTQLHLLQ
ncbi:hypothetical protein RIF29_38142 [Crotalaria pallida]|uniref:Pectinesterase inhibitor domain-containing protein n=1 Tax=Crotalaria pallida TaxID=3830 RepID=A0AAN9DYL9_CROPI